MADRTVVTTQRSTTTDLALIPQYRGAWAAVAYEVNDWVRFNNNIYGALVRTTPSESPTAAPSKWALLLQGGVGTVGPAATIAIGTVTTSAAGGNAAVVNSGTPGAAVFDITLPRGSTGPAGTVAVGTVTGGAAGTQPSVTNTGTASAAVLNFTIPAGATGATGAAGTATIGTVTTGAAGTNAAVTNTGTANAAILNFTIPRGADGAAAQITAVSATTIAAGQPATVTNVGTANDVQLQFNIPAGAAGTNGTNGTNGTQLPTLTGGTNNRIVKPSSSGAAAWVDVVETDQDLDYVAFKGSDGKIYPAGTVAPIAGSGLAANTVVMLKNPVSTGPNLQAYPTNPEPTPSNTFTVLVIGRTSSDGAYLHLYPNPTPLFTAQAVTPPQIFGEYKMLQTNETNKLYDSSGVASRASYTFNNGNATFSASGLVYTGEVNVDVAVPISDSIFTIYFAGKQADLAANHTVFGTSDNIGDPHAYWTFKTDGTQDFRFQNNSTVTGTFSGAAAASPAGVLKQWCLVVNGMVATLYDSTNTVVGTITGTVPVRPFINLWIGRRFYTGTPWIGTMQYFAIYHAAHTASERSAGISKMATAIAGRP